MKQEKLEWITKETRKLSPIFLTKNELDLNTTIRELSVFCSCGLSLNLNPYDLNKLIIRNYKYFKKWININLLFEENDLIKNNFLEKIFKSNVNFISSYQSDNIIDIYISMYKNGVSKNIINENHFIFENVRECYSKENKLLLPINDYFISKNERDMIKSSFFRNTIIIGYENLIKDNLFISQYNNILKKFNNMIYFEERSSKTYIFLNEKNAQNIYIPNNNLINILLYPNDMNINDVFNIIYKNE